MEAMKPAPFNAHDWQKAPWADTSPILLLTGSAGGGKSTLAAEKIHAYCLKYSGAFGLALRKDRAVMTNSVVLFLENQIIGNDPNVLHVSTKSRFEYVNGSILAYGGMFDQKQRQNIRSMGRKGAVDFVWMEEANAFIEDDFNEVLLRMRGTAAPWRQIVLTTNPDSPAHWIYQRLITGGEAAVFYSGAKDNPANPADYMATLEKLTGTAYKRLVLGQWTHAEGAVYDQFDAAVHVVDKFKIPREWRRYLVLDFGYTNPFVAQWWAEDNDGRLYLYREIYYTQRIVADHAELIKELSKGEHFEAIVCDHDAEDRATFERATGWKTTLARKDISPGIQAVQSRLRIADDGKPRLFIVRGSTVERDKTLVSQNKPCCTLDEITGYVWPKTKALRAADERPVKENDHGMDGMRYMVMHLERPRRTAPRVKFYDPAGIGF